MLRFCRENKMKKETFLLAKGLIRFDNKYLILKKAKSNYPHSSEKWECPGGRIEENETPKDALLREINEEIKLKCEIIRELPLLENETDTYKSKCYVYLLESFSKNVILSDEHTEFKWVNANDVKKFDLALGASSLLKYFDNPNKYLN